MIMSHLPTSIAGERGGDPEGVQPRGGRGPVPQVILQDRGYRMTALPERSVTVHSLTSARRAM